jgi:hypothetical protein
MSSSESIPFLIKVKDVTTTGVICNWKSTFHEPNTSVNIVIRLRIGRPGFNSREGQGFFLFVIAFRSVLLGLTQPPIQWVPGAKRSGREADHSLPSSAEVKNAMSYTSTSPSVFMSWSLVMYRIRHHGQVVI